MADRERFYGEMDYKKVDRCVYILGMVPGSEPIERRKKEGFVPDASTQFPPHDRWNWYAGWF
jgi:hypothetical protein